MSLVLPCDAWPDADRRMWAGLFGEGGPLDDQGPLVHLRATSRETLANRYGRWLKWVMQTAPDLLLCAPWERVSLDTLRDWLADLDHTAPMTRLMFVDGVLRVLIAARPELDWSAQKALRASLKSAAGRGTRSRKQGRVLSSAVLLEAGIRLATEFARETTSPLFRATQVRDGAMIALLALMPMRRRALANLRLRESVLILDDRITIALSADLTKTGVPWEADVPPQVLPVLKQYLETARPLLCDRGAGQDPHLWIDRNGSPLSYEYLGPLVALRTLQMTGISVPPHFFRDAAATTLARDSPTAVTLIRPVLGHSGFRTADRHYIHAQTIEAGRDYAAIVARLKKLV